MGFFSALQGFCVIGIIILAGYLASRARIGGDQAQYVFNRLSFFVSTPCLMFTLMANEPLSKVWNTSLIVALACAAVTGIAFFLLARFAFHLKPSDTIVGVLVSMYMNANNIGLPIATYILGDPAAVTPIVLMQQVLFTPIALTALDLSSSGKVSLKKIAQQPLHQPLLIGVALGIAASAASDAAGTFVVPSFIYDPINIIGQSAVPMILMAFGMSLHGSRPLGDPDARAATIAAAALKNVAMPLVAFGIAVAMGFEGQALYACVVLAALPTAQNVYNYAARYEAGTTFARDGILLSTATSPIVLLIIAALLGS